MREQRVRISSLLTVVAAVLVGALVQTPAASALDSCSAQTPCLPLNGGFSSTLPANQQAQFVGNMQFTGALVGTNASPNGLGVFGVIADATGGVGTGVRGEVFAGATGTGVFGAHDGGGTGVYGLSATGDAVHARTSGANASGLFAENAGGGWGILAQTTSATRPAIRGVHPASTGFGPGTEGESFSTADFASGVQGLVGFNGAGDGAAGVKGQNKSNGIYGFGVWGEHLGAGTGVLGTSNGEVGVWGEHEATTGASPGVEGVTHSQAANAAGVYGTINSNADYSGGVRGENLNTSCCGFGVVGFHAGQGIGIGGYAPNGFGVFGWSPNNWAAWLDGAVTVTKDLHVNGTLYKAGGAFRIDNPIDPAHSYLQHSFVESPDMKNIYDGVVRTNARGYATVTLPKWFQALNKDFRYQLTILGHSPWDTQARVWEEIKNNRFTIRTNNGNVKVSWQVTGIRHDPYANENRIQPIVPKAGSDAGKYAHPDLYGKPHSRSVVAVAGLSQGMKPKIRQLHFKAPRRR